MLVSSGEKTAIAALVACVCKQARHFVLTKTAEAVEVCVMRRDMGYEAHNRGMIAQELFRAKYGACCTSTVTQGQEMQVEGYSTIFPGMQADSETPTLAWVVYHG